MTAVRSFILMGCLLLAWAMVACVDEVTLPIRNETPQLVVEGLITDEPPPYRVKLTYSGTFESAIKIPEQLYVNDATVTLRDDLGKTTGLERSGAGLYQTVDSSFVGAVGRSYVLTVGLPDGKIYESQPEQMRPVAPIDSLTFEYVDVRDNSGSAPKRTNGYRVYVDTRDPAETGNYYRWTGYSYSRRHSTGVPCSAFAPFPPPCYDYCYLLNFGNEVHLFSDAAVNGNLIRKQYAYFSPIYTTGLHFVEVSQLSLTREAYQFWKRYEEQQTRVGSILDPLPATIVGNVTNATNPNERALGYFAASSVSRQRLVIYDQEHWYVIGLTEDIIKPGDCRQAFPGGIVEIPPGW